MNRKFQDLKFQMEGWGNAVNWTDENGRAGKTQSNNRQSVQTSASYGQNRAWELEWSGKSGQIAPYRTKPCL
jgi:hypothetical protein